LLWASCLSGYGQKAATKAAATKPAARPAAPAPRRAATGRTTVQYAKGFTIEYVGNYKVVTILSPFEQKTTATRYLLVPRGSARPTGYPESRLIETPIRSLVAMASLHIALADFLDAADVLVGVGDVKYASAPLVRQRIAAGRIFEVGLGKEMNNELLVSRNPDLVMATGWPGEGLTRFQTLSAAGIPVMMNSEWVETTPLARAEWVKVMAALLNKEDLVNEKFGRVAREYQRLAALAQKAPTRPSVVVGMPFKDIWHVPDTDSYMTQFLRDAGARYHWDRAKAPSGSLALSFEAVAPVALAADYWIHMGSMMTRADLLAQDSRYAAFSPFKTGRVFNNNRRTNAQGANDYWESGAVRPDVLLADLIRILHPELLPRWSLYYYHPLK
jgi:iron complex transport system substrate-binding protein